MQATSVQAETCGVVSNMSRKEQGHRLLSEAEWEYAARAGNPGSYGVWR
jgi:formylglycine-generating enzyme required for sulfatase activity